ncbi:MAG: hypothetical protein OXI13_09060, partial [Gammaproteobacteria bacterium]|nr:hypothetical protein [Gammaproteobacteria bacterium]
MRLFAALLLVLSPVLLPAGAWAQETVYVPDDWPLKPSGLGRGDEFRLLFLTSEKGAATSGSISHYNKFVQDSAEDLVTSRPAIRTHASKFRVVGSTLSVSARSNTSTTGSGGPPIYWVGGAKVADNYGDFYDGNWDSYAARNALGNLIPGNNRFDIGSQEDFYYAEAWTGTNSNGSTSSNPLGSANPTYGYLRLAKSTRGGGTSSPLSRSYSSPDTKLHFYALSPVFKVKGKASLRLRGYSTQGAENGVQWINEGYNYKPADQRPPGVNFSIDLEPAPTGDFPLTVRISDDDVADFLAPAEEGDRDLKPSKGRNTYGFPTRADPYTDVDGSITVNVTDLPDSHEYISGAVTLKVKNKPAITHPEISLKPPAHIAEGGTGRFVVRLAKAWEADDPLRIGVRVADDDAVDFLPPAEEGLRTLQIGKGQTSVSFDVRTLIDASSDSGGEISVTLTSTSSPMRPRPLPSAAATVRNDPAFTGREVRLAKQVTVIEGEKAVFTFEIDGFPRLNSGFDVELVTTELGLPALNTAQEGSDVTFADQTSNWPYLVDPKTHTIEVQTNEDGTDEPDEVFGLRLYNPRNLIFPGGAEEMVVRATIMDDDDPPELSLSSPQVTEGGTLSFEASLSSKSAYEISAKYEDTGDGTAKSGVRYDPLAAGTMTFAAGETQKSIDIVTKQDTVNQEDEETVLLRLSQLENATFAGGGRTLEATGAIRDDDAPSISVKLREKPDSVREGETAVFHAEVRVDGEIAPWDEEIIVLWFAVPRVTSDPKGITATSGRDFEPVSGRVVIPAGEASAPILVTTKRDKAQGGVDNVEGVETVGIRIVGSHIAGSPVTVGFDPGHWAIADIHDHVSAAVLISDAPKATEGQVMKFPVDLGAPAVDDVVLTWKTEDGTAVAGKDYTAANGRLTIPKGEQAAAVEVTTLQDTVDEPDQTFGVVVAKTSGTAESMRLRATGVIRDDDARPKIG